MGGSRAWGETGVSCGMSCSNQEATEPPGKEVKSWGHWRHAQGCVVTRSGCEGRGEREVLCIWDQAVWMATGHQGTEGAGLVRREDEAVGGCVHVQC